MDLGWPEVLLILVVVLIVFGVGKLPQAAAQLGKGIREFRKAQRGDYDEGATETADEAVVHAAAGSSVLTANEKPPMVVSAGMAGAAAVVEVGRQPVPLPPLTIVAKAGSGGSISPSGAVKIEHGADQVFDLRPDLGFHLVGLAVDSDQVGPLRSYAFKNVMSDHVISASFAINTYEVETSAGEGGIISPSGVLKVDHGGSVAFAIKPAVGYGIGELILDGAPVRAASDYSLEQVTEDHKIEVNFKGPRTVMSEVMLELEGIAGAGKSAKEIGNAVGHIKRGLEAGVWVSEVRLAPRVGNRVFEENKRAVKSLHKLANAKNAPGAIKSICGAAGRILVNANKSLAEVRLEDATAYAGTSEKVDRAIQRGKEESVLAQSCAKADKGCAAIDHYSKARQFAQQAIQRGNT